MILENEIFDISKQKSSFKIYSSLKEKIEKLKEEKIAKQIFSFKTISPELFDNKYDGEETILANEKFYYRSHEFFFELANVFQLKLLNPSIIDNKFIIVNLLYNRNYQENDNAWNKTDRYGYDDLFFKINKLENPSFLADYLKALSYKPLAKNASILNLGIGKGDEFAIFENLYHKNILATLKFTGIDLSESIINYLKERFPANNYQFFSQDALEFTLQNKEKYDLIISINLFQSPAIDSKTLFRNLIQNSLKEDGVIIIGLPNSRYYNNFLRYGARVKNYQDAELSLLLKDISFFKKYLQQHKFRVRVFGKYYLLLVGFK